MDVELPAGCNIINSSTSFYNYSNNNYTRSLYHIYDGKALLANSQTATRPYDYSGTCLTTGDLVYHPENQIYFQFLAIVAVFGIFLFVYNLLFKRFIK